MGGKTISAFVRPIKFDCFVSGVKSFESTDYIAYIQYIFCVFKNDLYDFLINYY